jgi:dTDP-4-dehydrorhamnose 3,5-epimerase-like enzyme
MIQLQTGSIEGVQTWDATGAADDTGLMCATRYRASNPERFAGYGDLLVMTLNRGGVRGFHYHKEGVDTAVVVAGSIRVVLFDMRSESRTHSRIQEVTLDAKPSAVTFLQIPPMVAHGFQGLADGSVLVDVPSSEEVASSDFFMAEPGAVPYEFRPI